MNIGTKYWADKIRILENRIKFLIIRMVLSQNEEITVCDFLVFVTHIDFTSQFLRGK